MPFWDSKGPMRVMSAPFSLSAQTRVAIIGAEGQLGREFAAFGKGKWFPFSRKQADLLNPLTLNQLLTDLQPHLVLNCAAYNLVDKAESDPIPCMLVNSMGVFHLARACRDVGATLVHFSTDHLFGAEPKKDNHLVPTPWVETDLPAPPSVYAASKAAGETFALASGAKVYIIRTCGLYGVPGQGGKGTNFVEAILRAVANQKPLRVVNDQFCTPTSVSNLQKGTLQLIENFPPGIYHLTDQGYASWWEFAREIVDLERLGVEVTPIPSKDWPAAAKRPFFSVLGSIHRENSRFPQMAHWKHSLKEYLEKRKAQPI